MVDPRGLEEDLIHDQHARAINYRDIYDLDRLKTAFDELKKKKSDLTLDRNSVIVSQREDIAL